MFHYLILIAIVTIAISWCGCSSGLSHIPTAPDGRPLQDLTACGADRILLTSGYFEIDPASLEAAFIPNRNAMMHYNATPWLTPPSCDECVMIEVLELKPEDKYLKVKAILNNPSQFTVYDVRGIIISNITGLNLLNADSYTDIWDDGGIITINPFKAFATDWPQRIFIPGSSHARIYEIRYPTFADVIKATVIIDASWPTNCKEPYSIQGIQTTGVFIDYEPQDIVCEVLSWNEDVTTVTIDLTCLGWDGSTTMTNEEGNWWAAKNVPWCTGGYDPGNYKALITAKCTGSQLCLFNYANMEIAVSAPPHGWARTWGGDGANQGMGVTLDTCGNIYAAGTFTETTDFDPSSGVDEYTSNGDFDAFVSKFDVDGNYQWAHAWGGTDMDGSYGIAVDNICNVYVTGGFRNTVDFDPSSESDLRSSAGSADVFLCKYDSDGNYLWTHTWGAGLYDWGYAITIDGSDNLYVTGSFCETVDFDSGVDTEYHTSNGADDVFLCKFTSSGHLEWTRTWGGISNDMGVGIAVNASGDNYVTGFHQQTVDFDPGPGVDERTAIFSDVFICKYDSEGEYQWAHTWGSDHPSGGWGVAVKEFEAVYVTGSFSGIVDFDPGPDLVEHASNGQKDVFLSKFDAEGEFIWAHTWGCEKYERGSDVKLTESGDCLVTGWFRDSVDFDPGDGIDEHTSNGSDDGFLSKFDPDGEFLSVYTWGGEGYNVNRALVLDELGNIFLSGDFWGSADFCPGSGIDIHGSSEQAASFLLKLLPDISW